MKAVFADTFYWVALTNPADSRYLDVVAIDSAIADATVVTTDEVLTEFLTFYAEDKQYSLVDCISMQTMRRHAITEVLTNDRHFEQEGFRALFRDS